MSEERLFQDADEQERLYAPEQLPESDQERRRAEAEDETSRTSVDEPPSAAPVANLNGTPTSSAAPPNIGNVDRGGSEGDPETQARDPFSKD